MKVLTRAFYSRSPLDVAPELLGKILVRRLNGQTLSGRIVETEAYLAADDAAAHSAKGRTKSNASLFLPAGHAYVHTIHMQHCLDVVTETIDVPGSVLIRAIEPISGIEQMQKLRGKEHLRDLTSGPGKLCQSLAITRELDGIDITEGDSPIMIVDDGSALSEITRSGRIGISKATEYDYRFYIAGNPFISKK